jgi:predicted nucleic acid-binding protein
MKRDGTKVQGFSSEASREDLPLFLSVIAIGEQRWRVDLIRHRGDQTQADALEAWLALLLQDYDDRVLPFACDATQHWGHLMMTRQLHLLDKQIAVVALLHDQTAVTRNTANFIPPMCRC